MSREARVKGKHSVEKRRAGMVVFERRILSKNNDGRQTTFKQKTLYRSLIYIIYVEKQDKEIVRIEEIL